MHIVNPTPFDVTALPMMGPGDHNQLTIIVKGTFTFAMHKSDLAADQVPIAYGDTFYEEDEEGGIRYESDLVPFKPNTDVVLSGQAYAPDKTPTRCMAVGLKVGPLGKKLTIFGRRLWNHAGVFSRRYEATEAKPFVIRPIRYRDAFGGMDDSTGEYCEHNTNGTGFYGTKNKANLAGKPLPLIEDPRQLIRNPKDRPRPVGFGFYHRAWQPRAAYAGTYDKTWRSERSPKPPRDFDFRFYNGAHPDLQADGFLQGEERVELINLTHESHMQFPLPGIRPRCHVKRKGGSEIEKAPMNLDTVFIEPDECTFCLVWRGGYRLPALSGNTIRQVSLAVERVSR